MSKADQFIQEHTRNKVNHITENFPWITVEEAKEAVKIAREEMIDKLRKWVASKNERDYFTFGYIDKHFDELLKQAMQGSE